MSKKYVFTKQQGVVLENCTDTDQFAMDNTRKFSDYNNFSNKNETINLINEVIDMCENEIQNSEFDFSDIEDVDHYNYNLANEQIVYFANYTNVLGQIYFNICIYAFGEELNYSNDTV